MQGNLITIFTFQITGLLRSESISNLSTKNIADVSMTPVPNITTLSSVPTITIPVSIPHQLTEGKYVEENAELYCLCKKPYDERYVLSIPMHIIYLSELHAGLC